MLRINCLSIVRHAASFQNDPSSSAKVYSHNCLIGAILPTWINLEQTDGNGKDYKWKRSVQNSSDPTKWNNKWSEDVDSVWGSLEMLNLIYGRRRDEVEMDKGLNHFHLNITLQNDPNRLENVETYWQLMSGFNTQKLTVNMWLLVILKWNSWSSPAS